MFANHFGFLVDAKLKVKHARKDSALQKKQVGPELLPGLRNYPAKFGQKMATLMNDLISEKKGIPELPESTPSAESTFSSMTFEDLWSEAYLTSVCHYLRGGNYLKIPPSFRELVPKKL